MTIQQASTLIGSFVPLLPASGQPQYWADLGCGGGLFTEALAGLLPGSSTVYGIDVKPQLQPSTLTNGTTIGVIAADFIKDFLLLRDLDGILMANSLHYVKDKPALFEKLRLNRQATASFLLVEYDTDIPVPTWVPYPLSFSSLKKQFGVDWRIEKLGERPSLYGRGNIYAAMVLPA